MLVELDQTINIFWKDLNTTLNGTATHPINVWSNTSISMPSVYQNTSLEYTNFFYHQDEDGSMVGQNITWAAKHTSIASATTFTVQGDAALLGTRFSVTAVPNNSGGSSLMILNQVNGSDIIEW